MNGRVRHCTDVSRSVAAYPAGQEGMAIHWAEKSAEKLLLKVGAGEAILEIGFFRFRSIFRASFSPAGDFGGRFEFCFRSGGVL
jgi:hypothetical protein